MSLEWMPVVALTPSAAQPATAGVDGARRAAAPSADAGSGTPFQALLESMGMGQPDTGRAGAGDDLAARPAADPVRQAEEADTSGAQGGSEALLSTLVPDALGLPPSLAMHAAGAPAAAAAHHSAPRHGASVAVAALDGGAAYGLTPTASAADAASRADGEVPSAAAPGRRLGGMRAAGISGPAASAERGGSASARDFMARVAPTQAQDDTGVAQSRQSLAPAHPGAVAPQVASLFESAGFGLRAGAGWRAHERTGAREPGPGPAHGIAGMADPESAGTRHGASPVYAPGALTPAPATALAEKVHYWVARGVQSAELQLDAFAGGSVDVRIALRGDEAVVEFRTDQPQARQLLADAMPQLKDLLAGAGLTLAGGFVGGSGQFGAGSRREDAPMPARHAAMVQANAPASGRVAVAGVATGGTVDLFV